MQAVEALCLQPQQLLQHLSELRNELLPALTGLYSKSQSVESAVPGIYEALQPGVPPPGHSRGQARALGSHESDPGMGAVAGAQVGAEAAQEGERVVREFVQQLLLPLFPSLLHEKDEEMLLPTYAQKMLVNLLDRGLVDPEEDLQRLHLTGRCFELLLETENFSAANMHSLRLCLILAALPQVTAPQRHRPQGVLAPRGSPGARGKHSRAGGVCGPSGVAVLPGAGGAPGGGGGGGGGSGAGTGCGGVG